MAAPALASMMAAIPAGSLVDTYGRKTIPLVGLSAMIVAVLYVPHASTFGGFILFAFFFGVSSQLVYTSLKAYLLDITPQGKSSKYFGVIATGFQVGLALGPAVGGYLMSGGLGAGLASASRFFALDLLLIILLILFFRIGEFEKKVKVQYTFAEFFLNGVGDYLKLGRVSLIVLWLTILFTTYEGLVWTLEPLFSTHYSLNSFTTGVILSMFILPFIVFNIPAGMLADRFGKMRVLIPGLIAAGAFMIVFGLVEDTFLLAASAFASTVGLAFAWTSMAGLLADASSKSRKGNIVGVWNTSEELGYLVGPILGGLVAQQLGINVPFIMVGLLMILTVLPVILLSKRYL